MTAHVAEPARQTPVFAEVDVLVVGGGPAGLAAAVAASRNGARTLLMERYGFLGGMGTAGGVTNFAGLYGTRGGQMVPIVRGVADELLAHIDALGGLNAPQDGLQGRIRVRSYDIPAYQCAADTLLREAGVQLLLHALACDVLTEPEPESAGVHITAALVQTRQGRVALRAREFIDCSGDADVAALAGAPFTYGDGEGGALYPSTMALIGGVDAERASAAVGSFGAIDALMAAAADRYAFARQGAILRPQRNPTVWRANVTQVADPATGRAASAVDAAQLSAAELEGRRQVQAYLRFLRAEVPGFERAELAALPAQLGIRESRRVHCEHMLSEAEVLGGARFDDTIGLNAWPVERHVAGRIDWAFAHDAANAHNQLPWRMLVPLGVANLLVAGRCAGMTHGGQSAARASGACFAMGQAAGTAAALRVAGGFNVQALQARLRAQGALLE